MAKNNSTINLMDSTGKLIDLTDRVLEVRGTLNNPSLVDVLSAPTGKDFAGGYNPGYVMKKAKRTQGEVAGATTVGNGSSRKGYSAPYLGKVFVGKVIREDNIIVSKYDLELLKEGKGGGTIPMETADFILTAKEKDVKFLFNDADTESAKMKIYTSITKAHTGDAYATVPAGAQPVQKANDTAEGLTMMTAGLRNVTATDLSTGDNAINLIRNAVGYLNTLGSEDSVEKFYPWSINGIALSEQIIVTNYKHVIKIKDSLTTTVVNLNNPGTSRNLNGLVAFIDSIPVYITNQSGPKVAFRVMTQRAFVRDLDATNQHIGTIKPNAGAVKMADDSIKNVGPDEVLIQFFSPRRLGKYYFEEIITIKDLV